ncbi:MAG: hypothetical protein JW881_02620 [Spirochaetales bacterium]|nr:hypothetical protein [Spirochaetales bacterium]
MYAILLGILSFSLKNIGYVFQKKGVNRVAVKRLSSGISRGIADYLSTGIWVTGIILPFFGGVLLAVAYGLGPVSMIMPFTATGFVVLVLFFRFYLGEKVTRIEWTAIALILSGTVMITLFAGRVREMHVTPEALIGKMTETGALLFLAIPNIICLPCSLVSHRRSHRYGGTIYALSAGIAGGTSLIFQKPFAAGILKRCGGSEIPVIPIVVCGLMFILLSILAVIILNVAYKYGRGIHIAPIYTVFQILLPTGGGIVIFEEWHELSMTEILIQAGGILLILAAAGILSGFNEKRIEKIGEGGKQ